MQQRSTDRVYGTRSIAAAIRRTQSTTSRLLLTGKIPGKLVAGRWEATAADCAAYLDARSREAPQ